MTDKIKLPRLDPDLVYRAIYEGVYDAMWQMITNATMMPCSDFFAAIEKAAENAFSKLALEKISVVQRDKVQQSASPD
jgi:hypothetical protein